MTAQAQHEVDRLMEVARQAAAAQVAPQAQPLAMPNLRRRTGDAGAAIALLFTLAFWGLAFWCIACGWGWQFVLGMCAFTSVLVLWARRP